MKLKCISIDEIPHDEKLTLGKIYETQGEALDDHYLIKEDNNQIYNYNKSRFEVVEISLEEELKAAKQKVKDLEEKIEANRIKVGQKYKTNGVVFMIADIGGKYTLVCVDGGFELGCSYDDALHDKIEDVFRDHRKYFTLIK